MRYMCFTKLFIFLAFVSFATFSISGSEPIHFKYGILKMNSEYEKHFIAVEDQHNLEKNSYFKFFFSPVSEVYIYVYHMDTSGEVNCLFPSDFDVFAKGYDTKYNYFIPSEEAWFSINSDDGEDTFYFIASDKRLKDLEKISDRYYKFVERDYSEQKILIEKEKLINEIVRLRRQNSNFTVFAEKPSSIAGTTRSTTQEKEFATEVIAEEFYAKTIRIKY